MNPIQEQNCKTAANKDSWNIANGMNICEVF